jgi:hypothetical protein
LEVLVARIDAPLLDYIEITFSNQLVFDIPQIARFIGHLEWPRPSDLSLAFSPDPWANIEFQSPESSHHRVYLSIAVLCKAFDWQVFSMAQICTFFLPFCSSLVSLTICYGSWRYGDLPPPEIHPDEMDSLRWLELFRSFTLVQRLNIPAQLESFIAVALQTLTVESAAEILPALTDLSVSGPRADEAAQQGIQSFITARQHSHHPVRVTVYREYDETEDI